MNKLSTNKNGGYPLVLDDFRWLTGQQTGTTTSSAGIYDAFNSIISGLTTTNNVIISGCFISGTTAIYPGWILLNGEILRVDAQPYYNLGFNYWHKSTSYEVQGVKYFQDGTTGNTWEVDRAILNTNAGGGVVYNSGNTITANSSVQNFGTVRIMNPAIPAQVSATTGTDVIDITGLNAIIGNTRKKIFNIGAFVPYGISVDSVVNVPIDINPYDIVSVTVTVIDDGGTVRMPLNVSNPYGYECGWWRSFNSGPDWYVACNFLYVGGASRFNTTDYSGSGNRGFVIVEYTL